MIATLPMYDRPDTAAAYDALWAETAARLENAPALLDHDAPLEETWVRPDLVLSQTCGLPFQIWVSRHARYVASPDTRLAGADAGMYYSTLVVRQGETRRPEELLMAKPVVNQMHSQSGYGALWRYAQELDVPLAEFSLSGSHLNSAKAVVNGTADIAAIDANTWRLIDRHDEWAGGLRVLDTTVPTPAPPFICGLDHDPTVVRQALSDAIDALSDTQRNTLGLYGVTSVPESAFTAFIVPPGAAKP